MNETPTLHRAVLEVTRAWQQLQQSAKASLLLGIDEFRLRRNLYRLSRRWLAFYNCGLTEDDGFVCQEDMDRIESMAVAEFVRFSERVEQVDMADGHPLYVGEHSNGYYVQPNLEHRQWTFLGEAAFYFGNAIAGDLHQRIAQRRWPAMLTRLSRDGERVRMTPLWAEKTGDRDLLIRHLPIPGYEGPGMVDVILAEGLTGNAAGNWF